MGSIVPLMITLLAACSSKGTSGLYGDKPDAAIGPPVFTAVSHNGAPRSAEHLKGHPTVIWFYPKAASVG